MFSRFLQLPLTRKTRSFYDDLSSSLQQPLLSSQPPPLSPPPQESSSQGPSLSQLQRDFGLVIQRNPQATYIPRAQPQPQIPPAASTLTRPIVPELPPFQITQASPEVVRGPSRELDRQARALDVEQETPRRRSRSRSRASAYANLDPSDCGDLFRQSLPSSAFNEVYPNENDLLQDVDDTVEQRALQQELDALGLQAGGLLVYDFATRPDYYAGAPITSEVPARRNIARGKPLAEIRAEIRHILPLCNITCSKCGARHWPDEANNASKRQRSNSATANFRHCCDAGNIQFNTPAEPYPYLLLTLLTGTTTNHQGRVTRSRDSREFLENIRHFNNSFAFTSLGIKATPSLPGQGPPIFRIQGALYHRFGSLLPPPDRPASFLQIYMYNGIADQEDARSRAFQNRNPAVSLSIANLLHRINPFANIFEHNRDALQDTTHGELALRLQDPDTTDRRIYNRPINESIAAIIPAPDMAAISRDIIIRLRSPTVGSLALRRLTETSAYYLPLRYPILFPRGELGWHQKLPRRGFTVAELTTDLRQEALQAVEIEQGRRGRGAGGSVRVSSRAWFACLLQTREIFNPILHAGLLFQEFVVDAGSVVESVRLNFYRWNQKRLRADLYQGAVDFQAADAAAIENRTFGRRIVLPSNHAGGPRNMNQHYQDAMAIARKHGGPDLFVTITCNPNWIEIQRELALGQNAADRPDLCARVFKLKLDAVLEDITKHHCFGRIAAHCHVIEFQKRGLPHAHILLICTRDDKIKTVDSINSIVSAEIPELAIDPQLYNIVTTTMLHTRCGSINPRAVCMQNAKHRCHARFPKAFAEETMIQENGYPLYRRPQTGPRVKKGDFVYDNRDVVPYSPYLSRKYGCHINVEVASGVGAYKYMYGYAYKGGDRITATLRTSDDIPREVDEIHDHIDARWLGPSEACWHIYEYPMERHYPPVLQLQVHEEDQQVVIWDEEAPGQIDESLRKTTLTEWFVLNQQTNDLVATGDRPPIDSTTILYPDFCQHYTWNPSIKVWKPRQRDSGQIGRMCFVTPRQKERYYLRLILSHVPGLTSFVDARTYQNTEYATYREACIVRGLLADDSDWDQTLREAAVFQKGRQLRSLFFYIIFHCQPSNPTALWQNHKENLSDDCQHRLRQPPYNIALPSSQNAQDLALCEIRRLLQRVSSDLTMVGLPSPVTDYMAAFDTITNRLVRDELSYDIAELQRYILESEPKLNDQQRIAVDRICNDAEFDDGGIYFLTGPGGTGKTFVENLALARLRVQGKVALAVATTGIAATLLDGGQTAHSKLGIPIPIESSSFCNITAQSDRAQLLRKAKLLIWDEAVMAHKHQVDAVDRTLRDLRANPNLPFGGLTVVFAGDFRQILPVIPRGGRSQIVNSCIKYALCWEHVVDLHLTQNMRLERRGITFGERTRIAQFAQRLLEIGEQKDAILTQLDRGDIVANNSPEDLAEAIYPGIATDQQDDFFSKAAILAAKNDIVDELNKKLLRSMPGTNHELLSNDRGQEPGDEELYTIEYLNSLNHAQLPPHRLNLKVGCPVMLLRNLNAIDGLCNGTRMRIRAIRVRTIECVILNGPHTGRLETIPRIPLPSPTTDGQMVAFVRQQFPIKLSFAMTINKAQGQSLERVGVLLDPEVFSHGQLYVALSRVTDPSKLRLATPRTQDGFQGLVRNVVYDEVFKDTRPRIVDPFNVELENMIARFDGLFGSPGVTQFEGVFDIRPGGLRVATIDLSDHGSEYSGEQEIQLQIGNLSIN